MELCKLPTPCYVVDEERLIHNLRILQKVEQDTGCHILLAQKAFSFFYAYPLIGEYISGTTASGLFEARLGMEEMGKENHVFSPAYRNIIACVLKTVWGLGLIRNVLPRWDMRFMIPVLPDPGWE